MAASWNHHKVLFWSSHGHLHRSFQQQKIRRFPTQHQGGEYPNFSAYPHIRIFNNTPERVKNTGIVAERPTVRHLMRAICTHCAVVKSPNGACTRGRHPSLPPTHTIKCRWTSNICADTIQRTLGDKWPGIVQHLTTYGIGGSRLHYHADDAAMDAPRPNQPVPRPAGLSTPSCRIRITRADIAQGP